MIKKMKFSDSTFSWILCIPLSLRRRLFTCFSGGLVIWGQQRRLIGIVYCYMIYLNGQEAYHLPITFCHNSVLFSTYIR